MDFNMDGQLLHSTFLLIGMIILVAWVFYLEREDDKPVNKEKTEPHFNEIEREEALRMAEWLEFNAAQQRDWVARDSANYIKKYLIQEIEND